MNLNSNILRILYIPIDHVWLPVFSVVEMLIISFPSNVRAQGVHVSSTTNIKGYHFLYKISDFPFI